MSEFMADTDRMKILSSDLLSVSNSVGNVLSELSGMNLNGLTGNVNLQSHLRRACSDVGMVQRNIYRYGESLGNISGLYMNAEKGPDLQTVKPGRMPRPYQRVGPERAKTVDKTAVKVNKDVNKYRPSWKDYSLNVVQDGLQTLVEKGLKKNIPKELLKRGILTKDGAGNFTKFLRVSKKALPIAGAVFDVGCMLHSGESLPDALAKGALHFGVGVAGGKIGAAIGAGIGSIIPGAGTVVGGVIGAGVGVLAGAVFTTVTNSAVDLVYDKYAHAAVRGVVHGVKTAGETVVKAGKNVADGIGQAFRSSAHFIGSIFG